MADLVRVLRADVRAPADQRVQVDDNELMTAQRAFRMLPNSASQVQETENWRCQMLQLLSEDPYLLEFL